MPYKSHFLVPIPDVDTKLKRYVEGLHKRLESEFKAIEDAIPKSSVTSITIGGGGGGGGGGSVGTKLALVVTQTVTGPADITVSFPALSTANYGVIAILQNSSGDFSFGQPKQPPLTDTRSLTQVTVTVQESGVLRSFIILE